MGLRALPAPPQLAHPTSPYTAPPTSHVVTNGAEIERHVEGSGSPERKSAAPSGGANTDRHPEKRHSVRHYLRLRLNGQPTRLV
jgi:hypothetical protein